MAILLPDERAAGRERLTGAAVEMERRTRRERLQAEYRHTTLAELDAQAEYWNSELDELPLLVADGDVEQWIADGHACDCVERLELIEAELRRRVRVLQPGSYRAAQYFDSDFPRHLKQALQLPEFIAGHVSGTALKRAGDHFVGLCPFHTEKTPSFHVWGDHFHCFGCGAHGDVFGFLSEVGLPFPDAVRIVAQWVGVAMPAPRRLERSA